MNFNLIEYLYDFGIVILSIFVLRIIFCFLIIVNEFVGFVFDVMYF